MYYKTKKFTIQELVHPVMLNAIGETNCWMRLDRGCLEDLDYIREEWGDSIYVNRLNHGLDSRGFRHPTDPDGSKYSMHKYGKAFDLEPKNGNHQELWDMIHKMIVDGKLSSINTLEDRSFTPTWTHIAKMNISGDIYIVKP